jgi:hypothetical protein
MTPGHPHDELYQRLRRQWNLCDVLQVGGLALVIVGLVALVRLGGLWPGLFVLLGLALIAHGMWLRVQ